MICSTVTAGTGVWAAAQNVMQASDNISFVADPYADAVFTDSVNTFTFESPRIPYGNTKHYGGNPIGHSRTYTLP